MSYLIFALKYLTFALEGLGSGEGGDVGFVLGGFHLLDNLSEGSAVTRSVLSDDADLGSPFGHVSI